MESSPNQNLLPMCGTVEHETRARLAAARAVRLIIEGLTVRHTQQPFPAMSDHYRENESPVELPPTLFGWDVQGNYVSRGE